MKRDVEVIGGVYIYESHEETYCKVDIHDAHLAHIGVVNAKNIIAP